MMPQLSIRRKAVIGGLFACIVVAIAIGVAWWMGWSVVAYFTISLGALALLATVLGVALWRSSRQTDDLRRAATQEARHLADRQQAEVEALDRALDRAFRTLDTAARKRTSGAEPLPRILVLGPAGSGKSSMLAASGLNFPLRTEETFLDRNPRLSPGPGSRSSSGTRNCEAWCASDAIFFDTAGRYVNDPEAETEWLHLLNRLRASGGDRPVSGLIVCVSLRAILTAERPSLERRASRIRTRVQQVVERLGVRPPVHLVFTQCDGLEGFGAFFDDCPQAHRDAVWGHTFALPSASEDAGGALPDLDTRLDEAYDVLIDRLRSRRTWVLSRPMASSRSAQAYRFPQAFAEAKPQVQHLLQALFCRNPYQETPLWRGFYFTSNRRPQAALSQNSSGVGSSSTSVDIQEGGGSGMSAPSDRGTPSGFGAMRTSPTPETTLPDAPYLFANPPRPSINDPEDAGQARFSSGPMFLKSLFEDVVLRDAYMCRPTARAWRRAWSRRTVAVALSVIAVGAFCIGAVSALEEARSELASLRSTARQVQETNWALETEATPGSRMASLGVLHRLHDQEAALRTYDQHPPTPRWGLMRGGVVLDVARSVHVDAARAILQRRSLAILERRLAEATRGEARPTTNRSALYDDLRAYLLLTTDAKRLSSPTERVFLVEHLDPPFPSRRNSSAAVTGSDPWRSTVEAWASAVLDGRTTSFPGRAVLIERARALVYEPPSIDRVYRLLVEEGEARLPPLTLGDVLEGRDVERFVSRPVVSGLYTRRGYASFVESAIDRETALPGDVDWVMGYRQDDIPRSMQSADTLAAELHARYFREYAAAWSQFLETIRIRPFDSVRDAAHGLQALGDVRDSPLTRILGTVSLETRLGVLTRKEPATQAADLAQKALRRQSRTLHWSAEAVEKQLEAPASVHPVDRRFAWLHALGWDEASVRDASPDVQSVLEAYTAAGRELEDVTRSPDRAPDLAARVLQEGTESELEYAMKQIRTAPSGFDQDVRHELFEQPIISAWQQVVAATQRSLNRQWQREVHRPFQDRLAGRYPFDATSSSEASIHDVEAFFQPVEGAIATFRTSALAPFLREDTIQPNTWQGVGLHLSDEARMALTASERIEDRAFEAGVLRVEFQLRADHPESTEKAPAAQQIVLRATGQTMQYDMGSYRPWTTFVWPGRPGAVLRIDTPQNELPSYTLSGAWAWFRLYDLAHVERQSSTTSVLRWPMGPAVQAMLRLRTDRRGVPGIQGARFFRFKCPARLD